jgi:hypothetical protein
MHLLERKSNGDFSTTEFIEDKNSSIHYTFAQIGTNSEEITLKELIDGTSKSKAGYNKIRLCGEQARRDGLQYFRVDTCCM